MNKQIEEMANDLAKICPDLVENCCGEINCVTHLTLSLSKLGYRKTEDVAREIFEVIDEMCFDLCGNFSPELFAIIKKKFTESGFK